MGTLLLIILIFVLPYIVGQAWSCMFRFKRCPRTAMECYSYGIVAIGACFYIVSWVPLQQRMSLSQLSKYCLYAVVALAVISICIANVHLLDGCKETVKRFGQGKRQDWMNYGYMVMLLVIAVAFAKPAAEDLTPEIVETMLGTDTLYACDPYSGEILVDVPVNHNPIEAVYAVLAFLTGAHVTWMIHRVLPVVFIIAAWGTYSLIGKVFYSERSAQAKFMSVMLCIMTLTLFMKHSVFLGILTTPWNGATVLTMVVLPLQFYMAMECCLLPSEERTRFRMVMYVLSAGVGIVSAQLCFTKASVISLLLWLVAGIVLVWRQRHAKDIGI